MTQEYTQDEINAILASIEVDDAQIAKDDRYSKVSVALSGRESPRKGKAATRDYSTSGFRGKHTEETKQKNRDAHIGKISKKKGIASGDSIYMYITPKGEFADRMGMIDAYKDVFTFDQCMYRVCRNKDGFSRRLKDV
jgi:hypothetical protein